MKKNLLILLAGMIFCGSLSAQDLIFIKPHNSTIEAKVIEITEDQIKYKDFNNLDGPIRTIDKSDVSKIVYENGIEEEFKVPEKPKYNYENYLDNPQQPTKNQPTEYKGKYFLIGAGFGNSYGGIGAKFAGRFGGQLGFGFHGGLGYLPFIIEDNSGDFESSGEGAILFSAGFQFFFYKWIYVDLQFGSFGIEQSYSYSYYYDPYSGNSSFTSEYGKEILYGPSILVGGDFIFGKHFGFNAASGFSYNINDAVSVEVVFAFDIGFIVAF